MFSAITVSRTFLKMVVGTRLARWEWAWNAGERKATTRPPRRRTAETGGG
jgi:hypothetical protein